MIKQRRRSNNLVCLVVYEKSEITEMSISIKDQCVQNEHVIHGLLKFMP